MPAVQRLIKTLKLKGCVVAADALNCQTETASAVIRQGGDWLFCVKDNQESLMEDIRGYVQDPGLPAGMETASHSEKNRDRFEERTAYVTGDLEWMEGRKRWKGLRIIGMVRTQVTAKKGKTDEWHYCIPGKALTAEDLLRHAGSERAFEPVHWLPGVHFDGDKCRVQDRNVRIILNIIRKTVLNSLRVYRDRFRPGKAFTSLMVARLVDPLIIKGICAIQN